MNIILWDYESVWPDVWPQNKCRSLWLTFHGPLILPICWRRCGVLTWNFAIMSSHDPTFDCKINAGHCDLFFMVHWFCLLSWRLINVWTSYFEIMSQYDPTFDLKINVVSVTYISWSSDFSFCLEDCLMYEHHYLGLWVSMTRHLI